MHSLPKDTAVITSSLPRAAGRRTFENKTNKKHHENNTRTTQLDVGRGLRIHRACRAPAPAVLSTVRPIGAPPELAAADRYLRDHRGAVVDGGLARRAGRSPRYPH